MRGNGSLANYPERACMSRGCPYIGIYMFVYKKKLIRTLVIDSPFLTFAVGLLVKFIDYLPLLSSSRKSRIFLYNAHLALFVQMDDTSTRTKQR